MNELTELEEQLTNALQARAATASPPTDAWDQIVAALSDDAIRVAGDADDIVEFQVLSDEERGLSSIGRKELLVLAAAAIVLLAGLYLALRSTSDDSKPVFIEEPQVTTVVPTTVVPTPETEFKEPEQTEEPARTGLIEPGRWSVAATVGDPALSSAQLSAIAEDVGGWSGVLEVATAADEAAWSRLTGFDTAACEGGSSGPPCGSGIILLVEQGQAESVARRLESDLSMTTRAGHNEPFEFLAGYIAAAVASASPVPLRFDPTSLGNEIVLSGPFVDVGEDEGCQASRCDVAVDVNVDGKTVRFGVALLSPERIASESTYLRDLGNPTVVFSIGESSGCRSGADCLGGISLHDVSALLPGDRGSAAVAGNFDLPLFVGRRSFSVFGLPLDVAVVAIDLADGSTVWQRPLAGMAFLFDEPGSFEPDSATITAMTAFDADGNVILLIEGSSDGSPELVVTDQRVSAEPSAPSESDPRPDADLSDAGVTVTWSKSTSGGNVGNIVGTRFGILAISDGVLVRWTDGARWESVPALADVNVDALADGGEFVLASGSRPTDGNHVLMRSLDGQTWTRLDVNSSFLERVGLYDLATSSIGLTLIGNGGVLEIDGDLVSEVEPPAWRVSCCNQTDVVEFDGRVVVLLRDFNEPPFSVAWPYLGDAQWGTPRDVPISSNVEVLGDTVLMFDHTGLGCCREPVGAESESNLLASTDGLEWSAHSTLDSPTTNGLQIEAGEFFWVYGLHGSGGNNIERVGEFATLWISTDAETWSPLDISFTPSHSLVEVAGDTIFISGASGSGQEWVGHVQRQ
jgi:hypothetical protein